jgi:hypothetical protein
MVRKGSKARDAAVLEAEQRLRREVGSDLTLIQESAVEVAARLTVRISERVAGDDPVKLAQSLAQVVNLLPGKLTPEAARGKIADTVCLESMSNAQLVNYYRALASGVRCSAADFVASSSASPPASDSPPASSPVEPDEQATPRSVAERAEAPVNAAPVEAGEEEELEPVLPEEAAEPEPAKPDAGNVTPLFPTEPVKSAIEAHARSLAASQPGPQGFAAGLDGKLVARRHPGNPAAGLQLPQPLVDEMERILARRHRNDRLYWIR